MSVEQELLDKQLLAAILEEHSETLQSLDHEVREITHHLTSRKQIDILKDNPLTRDVVQVIDFSGSLKSLLPQDTGIGIESLDDHDLELIKAQMISQIEHGCVDSLGIESLAGEIISSVATKAAKIAGVAVTIGKYKAQIVALLSGSLLAATPLIGKFDTDKRSNEIKVLGSPEQVKKVSNTIKKIADICDTLATITIGADPTVSDIAAAKTKINTEIRQLISAGVSMRPDGGAKLISATHDFLTTPYIKVAVSDSGWTESSIMSSTQDLKTLKSELAASKKEIIPLSPDETAEIKQLELIRKRAITRSYRHIAYLIHKTTALYKSLENTIPKEPKK